MTTLEILKMARGLAAQGYGPSTYSVADWPDAADLVRRANSWWRPIWWMPVHTKGMAVRALDRAVYMAEQTTLR